MSPEAYSEPLYERRMRRSARPISRGQSVYEWIALLLLLASPCVGAVLYGAVRWWSVGPLLLAALLGVFMTVVRPLRRPDLRYLQRPPGGILWLAFLAYSAVSIFRAAVPYEARLETLRWAGYIGAYWAWTELAFRRRRQRHLVTAALLFVTVLAWYALIQHAQGSRMVLRLERPEQYGMRASGTYMCPNHFASLLALMLPFAWMMVSTSAVRLPSRLVAGYALFVLLPTLFLTQSRSGWLGAFAGLYVCAVLMALRHSVARAALRAVLLPVLAAALGVTLYLASPVVRARVQGAFIHDPDPAVKARMEIWRDTLPMIRERWLLGHGPGSYRWVYPRFRTHDNKYLINYAHNEALHFAAEYGVFGLGLMGLATAAMMIGFLRHLRSAERDRDGYFVAAFCGSLVGALVHSVFDFNLHVYSVMHMLVFLGGMTAAGLYQSGTLTGREVSGGRAWMLWGGATLGVLFAMAVAARTLAGYALHHLGEKARVRLDDRAETLFRIAKAVDSPYWRSWLGLGHLYRTRAFWAWEEDDKKAFGQQALDYYDEAHRRNRLDMMVLYGKAQTYNALGQPDEALALLRKINELDRNNGFFFPQLALQLRLMGRDEEALEMFREAARRWPNEMISINIRILERRRATNPQ